MTKAELRKMYNGRRRALTPQQQMRLDDLLLIQFQKLRLPPIQSVLSFYPIEEKNEVNTFLLTRYLQFQHPGLVIAYPKANLAQNSITAIAADESGLFAKSSWGIAEPVHGDAMEPEFLDAALVPMVVGDSRGARVGYGKGFYDRFLQNCRPDCLKIGLCYFEPVARIEDTNEFDVPLNYCITPQTVYVF